MMRCLAFVIFAACTTPPTSKIVGTVTVTEGSDPGSLSLDEIELQLHVWDDAGVDQDLAIPVTGGAFECDAVPAGNYGIAVFGWNHVARFPDGTYLTAGLGSLDAGPFAIDPEAPPTADVGELHLTWQPHGS